VSNRVIESFFTAPAHGIPEIDLDLVFHSPPGSCSGSIPALPRPPLKTG